MSRRRTEIHLQQVEAWKKLNSGLSSEEMTQLFVKAILAIRLRCLNTLSEVTVNAVFERAVVACKEKFPILSNVTNDTSGIHFESILENTNASNQIDTQQGLQELLIELLDVFGKITAEILTKYLHQELMAVTNATKIQNSELRKKKNPRYS